MIIRAILKINPNASVVVKGNDLATCGIEWHNGTPPISKADIEAQFPIVKFEMAMEDLRRKRNALLAETDWTQFVDSPLTAEQKYSYAEYRQQLRDATEGLTTVEQINSYQFPVRP